MTFTYSAEPLDTRPFCFTFILSEDAVDMLREIGGETFIYNLAKSNIVCSDVKETALFTLGTLAEANGRYMLLNPKGSMCTLS